ncbi:peptidoglycan-binding protein [Paraliobacillus ryukyuensis]|uniref:peptidoglycan-binding protein n=1 Tax=Paraliobacillus ryukyuensis TaxID=200904 RepID=UPI0009A89EE1|nr:peptidoglycan-binding protein [Paraliobacillus ryukyuensis]
MTVSLKTLLDRSERNMGAVHSVVKEATLELIKRAYKEGILVQISDGFRSYAEQNTLYAKGRTAGGSVVTNARGGQSYHNFGLAVDYFLVSDDGNKALWNVNKDWRRVAAIGKSLGFEWGGDWSSFKDYPHLQMTGGLSLSQLRAGKKPNLNSDEKERHVAEGKIAYIQSKLNDRYGYHLSVDNIPGPNTRKALVKAYQTELNKQFNAGLKVDGVWGPKTKAESVVVKKGAEGNLTWVLQALLRCEGYDLGVDGIFGNETEETVEDFQNDVGIAVDGRPGPVTFGKLLD